MPDKYAVVIFETDEDDEETVEIISASWLEEIKGKTYCFWPPHNQFNKARKHQRPDKELWKRYKIRRVWLVDDFEKAKRLRDNAVDTSHPEDEGGIGDEPLRKRQRQAPTRLIDDTYGDDADIESEDSESLLSSPKKVPRRTSPRKKSGMKAALGNKPGLPVSPKFTPAAAGHSLLKTPRSVRPTDASKRPPQPVASSVKSTSPSTSRSSHSSPMVNPERRNAENSVPLRILLKLNQIEENQLEIKQMLKKIHTTGTSTSCTSGDVDEMENPADSIEELMQMDAKLRNDDQFKKTTMKYLTMVGGGDTGETVRRMMRKVGTNNVWSQYNMVGRGGKRSFKATTVFKVIMSK
ncbi:uncharacterized protein [Amphiura filiformis]|uniref:uncharacterized protein n=1 Tax=Amphiura filiformis TaxID=82378 RepID=UPI003B21347F